MSNPQIEIAQKDQAPSPSSLYWVFDEPNALAINKARIELIASVLETLSPHVSLKSALDVGAGIGYFSRFLKDKGLEVLGIEGREENVREAQRRHPDIQFLCRNVEDPSLPEIGTFDLVLAVGLLYHLENPFAAVRNLAKMTNQVLLIESMVIGWELPSMMLIEESKDINQGLNHIAFYPSESCLVAMLHHAGMPFIYRPKRMPDHIDFRRHGFYSKARTVLIATRFEVSHSAFVPVRRDVMYDFSALYNSRFEPINKLHSSLSYLLQKAKQIRARLNIWRKI